MAKVIFRGISELVTMRGAARKGGRQVNEGDLDIIPAAAMVADDGKIVWLGLERDLPAISPCEDVWLGNSCVLPGFVECHTHLAFAGDRAQEFEWRMQGATYQEIAARGGGIVSTVAATRSCSDEQLRGLMQVRANRFLEQGVTTLEVKSGYGLDVQCEMRSLSAARALTGPRVVTTFLGPHSKPAGMTIDDYFEQVMTEILPAVALAKLADRADIFVEKGFFSSRQAERYFAAARTLGLDLTAHVEQLSHSGGTAAALRSNAASVDHVVEIGDDEISQLAKSETVAVLLPASDFYLKMKYPPARALIDRGACVALSTDFNPGTSPTQEISFIGVLARLEMKMSLPEVLSAWTFGAARALKKDATIGSLDKGKECDFLTISGDWRALFYSVGLHPVQSVWVGAQKLFEKKF